MGFEDLATKNDLKEAESKLLKAIVKHNEEVKVPEVVLAKGARKMMGGVSDTHLRALRREGKLNPTQVGKLWFYNVKEIVALLPPDPKEK